MSVFETNFAALLSDWSTVRSQLRSQIMSWEQHFAILTAEESSLRDHGRWIHGRADFLGVLGRHRDELAHSRMIAWLLDPCGRHGLGSRILEGLLEQVFGSRHSLGLARARTRCEVPLIDGRLDIVVEAPGLYLVIENKVDAEEGEDQCAYYGRHLRKGSLCILLSPEGRDAKNASIFKPLRYSQFAAILSRALANADEAAPGRRIAEDYLHTLNAEFYDAQR
jgi:hypothetical protein